MTNPSGTQNEATMPDEVKRLHLAINDAIHWIQRGQFDRAEAVLRAALSASGNADVPPLPRPAYCEPHEFLLLSSYCGDDNDACSERRPCADCLAMCNVFGEDGKYLRELGTPPAEGEG